MGSGSPLGNGHPPVQCSYFRGCLGKCCRVCLWGNTRMARARHAARRPIFWWLCKKLADLDLPHKSQEECVPRGVSKVSPSFEVEESLFGLSVAQLHTEWLCNSS